MIRSSGYNGFSFREIAAEIGIKSSSVHHHFPAKGDLALAVANRYSGDFFAALGDPAPSGSTCESRLLHYCQVFERAHASTGQACLCGMLSHEADLLPDKVKQVVTDFVDRNVCWIEEAIVDGTADRNREDAKEKAYLVYCSIEGAMAVASLKQNEHWIAIVSDQLVQNILRS